jgi:hypothetical protein
MAFTEVKVEYQPHRLAKIAEMDNPTNMEELGENSVTDDRQLARLVSRRVGGNGSCVPKTLGNLRVGDLKMTSKPYKKRTDGGSVGLPTEARTNCWRPTVALRALVGNLLV